MKRQAVPASQSENGVMNQQNSGGGQIPYIHELASSVRKQWKRVDYCESSLPDIAVEAFGAASLPDGLNLSKLLTWGITAEPLPVQGNNTGFGNPPICLHHDERFYIDAYVWRDSTTTIHDHGFNGAFCVLQGESLQTRFRFQADDHPTASLEFGDLHAADCEVLSRGDIRPIHSGSKLIHSVFHLMHPSVTLCIRSFQDSGVLTQREYHLPHTAHFSSGAWKNKRSPLGKRLAMIECGFGLRDSTVKQMTHELVAAGDWMETFQIVSMVATKSGIHEAEPLLEKIGQRHGGRAKRIESTLRETCRRQEVLGMRQLVRNQDQRFLIALLANLPDRQAILNQIRLRYPEAAPAEQIGRIYSGIAESLSGCVTAPIAKMHSLNALAIPHMLQGLPDNLVIARVMEEGRQNNMKFDQTTVEASVKSLPDANLLKPLFSEPLVKAA